MTKDIIESVKCHSTNILLVVAQLLLFVLNIFYYINNIHSDRLNEIKVDSLSIKVESITDDIKVLQQAAASNALTVRAISSNNNNNIRDALLEIRNNLEKEDPARYRDIILGIDRALK